MRSTSDFFFSSWPGGRFTHFCSPLPCSTPADSAFRNAEPFLWLGKAVSRNAERVLVVVAYLLRHLVAYGAVAAVSRRPSHVTVEERGAECGRSHIRAASARRAAGGGGGTGLRASRSSALSTRALRIVCASDEYYYGRLSAWRCARGRRVSRVARTGQFGGGFTSVSRKRLVSESLGRNVRVKGCFQ